MLIPDLDSQFPVLLQARPVRLTSLLVIVIIYSGFDPSSSFFFFFLDFKMVRESK